MQPYIKFNENNVVELTESSDDSDAQSENGTTPGEKIFANILEVDAVLNADDNEFNYFNNTPKSSL